jgi:hypothetical protein
VVSLKFRSSQPGSLLYVPPQAASNLLTARRLHLAVQTGIGYHFDAATDSGEIDALTV